MFSGLHVVDDSYPEIFTAIYAGTIGLVGLFYCLVLILALVFFVLWLWMLIDCLKRDDYDGPNDKLLWVLLMLFAGIIGTILYYFIVKRVKDENKKEITSES